VTSSADGVTAFAPASVSNLAVGFDVLGFAFPVLGDRVTASLRPRSAPPKGGSPVSTSPTAASHTPDEPSAVLSVEVIGPATIPLDPERNTASVAVRALLDHLAEHRAGRAPDDRRETRAPLDRPGEDEGLHLRIEKGIPLSAGLGGSAASAVAAVHAANELLGAPLSREELLPFALEGEAAASGGIHPDNVVPSLVGGVTATLLGDPPRIVPLPVPDGLHAVVAHPHVEVETRSARSLLEPSVPLALHVEQSACLAAFVAALHSGDLELLRASMQDLVVGPQRTHLVPGFEEAREAVMAAGAIGCAISGAGPSVFAWTDCVRDVEAVGTALADHLGAGGTRVDVWDAPVGGAGVRRVTDPTSASAEADDEEATAGGRDG